MSIKPPVALLDGDNLNVDDVMIIVHMSGHCLLPAKISLQFYSSILNCSASLYHLYETRDSKPPIFLQEQLGGEIFIVGYPTFPVAHWLDLAEISSNMAAFEQ